MRSLRITYDYEAWEWWNMAVSALGEKHLFVQISPHRGGAPFDAFLYGPDEESDVCGAVKIRRTVNRATHPDHQIETVIAEKIHVY